LISACMYLLVEACDVIVKNWIHVNRPTLDTTIQSIDKVVNLVSYMVACCPMSSGSLRET